MKPTRSAPTRSALSGASRAEWAWAAVDRGRKSNKDRFATLASKLPSMVQSSGLGQTMAFLYGKGGGPEKPNAESLLLSQLHERVLAVLGRDPSTFRGDPMQTILQLSPAEYRLASREVQASLSWLKRFAEGRIGDVADIGG